MDALTGRTLRAAAAAVLAVAALAGCAPLSADAASDPSASAPAATATPIGATMDLTPGHQFTSISGTIDGEDAPWLGSRRPFVITTAETDGKTYFHGTVGCNGLGAQVSWDGDTVTPGADGLWMSQKGCSDPLPAHERFAVEFLQSALTYRYDGTTLSLSSGAATVMFVRSDAPLLGHTYESTAGVPDELEATKPATLLFAGTSANDLGVVARISCNTASLSVVVRGDTLVVRPENGGITLMACGPVRDRQDAWLQALIESTPRIAVDGDTLTLTSATDTVVFRRTA